MAVFPVYELTVYDSDDSTALFAVGTDPSHSHPYLKVPTDFSEQEVDFVKSSASIGQVTIQVIDKRTVSTDQSTGYITGLLADASGYSQLNGHRAVLTEDLGAGAAKIMDGVIRGVTLMDTFVGFEFELRDIRERERKTKAFQTTDTPTVLPRGVLNGYGFLTTVPFFESLSSVYPVPPTRPLLCQYLQVTSSEGIVDYGTVPGPRLAELLLTAPMRDALEHIEPLDGEPALQVYGWFKVLWRDHATGGAYTTLTQIAQTHPSLQGGGGKPAYEVQTLNNGPSIATLAVNNVVSGATLPSDGQSIDVIVQYDGPVTEDWRYHLQNLTVGELLRNAYRGDYSESDPRIRYDEAALLALTTPVRMSLGKPVDDLRDWCEKNAYPIELAAPTLDDDGRISPRTAALPDASVTPVNLGDSNCRPAGGGWSHPSQDAVNLVVVTYKREYAITNDGSIAASDTLREREVQVSHEIPESIVLLGEQKLEIESVLLRAVGTRDKGGALYGDIQDELGAQVAERITRVATDRFALGGQYFAVDGARSDADVEGLRVGSWVIVGHSWIPDYVAGTRGASRLAQVVNRRNLNASWCSLVLQDAGSANAPVTQPTLGTVTIDSSGVVSIPVSAIGTGDEARVDYAVNATEPAAGSELWTYAGRTASPATIKTQAFPPGSTIWVRARGEGVGQRPSAYTTAVSVAAGSVARALNVALVIDDATGIPTVSWIPNGDALGVRLYYEVHDADVVPSFASSVDVDASDLEHEFSALTVDSGEVFSCKLEPYTGWTGSAVSGTAGPDVIVDIIRSASGYALAVQAISDAAGAQATADGKVTTFVQTSAPTAEGVGDLWLDSDDGNKPYRWSGSAWVVVQDAGIAQAISDAADAQSTADGKIVTFYQTTAPSAGEVGDLWVDTDDNNKPYRWSGSAWVSIRDATIASAQSAADAAQAAADDAQATADGKITTFYQTSAPTADGIGDLWVDTDDGNKLYRWSGSAWVSVRDGTIATAQSTADTAQATADGKIVSFYSTSAPTADGVGDIWIDTDDGNKPYRWSGSAWVSVDKTIIEAGSFTATNPVFTGTVDVEGGSGNKAIELAAGSSGARIFLYDESGNQVADLQVSDGGGGVRYLDWIIDDGWLIEPGGFGFAIGSSGTGIKGIYSATKAWNPGSIAAFDQATTTVTVTGAAVGDAVFVPNEFKADDKAFELSARVTAANTVTLYLHNTYTGGALDPGSRTLRVVVMKF